MLWTLVLSVVVAASVVCYSPFFNAARYERRNKNIHQI